MNTPYPDRDIRQRVLVPPEKLAQVHALVIGVGAIGRQVALQLAALGVSRMTLVDHDHVAVENLAAQGYWPSDLQLSKVLATAELCRRILPGIEVVPREERYRRHATWMPAASEKLVVLACVDSISTRRMIWESLQGRMALFLDGRMQAEVMRILAHDARSDPDRYAASLFPEAEAQAGPCTARSTIYTASIAAGLMVAQLVRWLRHLPLIADQTLNLLSGELIVTD